MAKEEQDASASLDDLLADAALELREGECPTLAEAVETARRKLAKKGA